MLAGQMMQRPLLIASALEHGAEVHREAEVVSVTTEGGVHRYGYPDAARRAAQLAHALYDLGIKPGDRVATLAWNGYRHFELYYAISGMGAVCHTINPRLFADQLIYIVNHAADRVLFYDTTFAPLVAKLRPHWPKDLLLVAMTDAAHLPGGPGLEGQHAYESLLAGRPTTYLWPDLDENAAASLCYTSGTTGEPKGALYSHRSSILHSLFVAAAGPQGLKPGERVLPVVPLFHVNAWGLPYVAPIAGCSLIFPGSALTGDALFDLMQAERVTSAWGVTTVWMGLLAEMAKRGAKPAALKEVIIGGSAATPSMIEAFEVRYDVRVVHGWGMTEMSPVGTLGKLSPTDEARPLPERLALKARQGRRLFGVDFKILDDAGKRLPHDGVAAGELYVRGSTIISGYYNNPEATAKAFDRDGWFGTGDIARITPDGYLIVVDRVKDLVKSGGEWISSLDVENIALQLPGLLSAALIGVPHPKWSERPLLVAVRQPNSDVTRDAVLAQLAGRLARWQVPDDVIFVEQLPLTATGKVSKLALRKAYHEYQWEKS
jgi:fatty-acyl-CoA synthase